jgi:hypothetical protein
MTKIVSPPCINCISLAICRTRLIHDDLTIYPDDDPDMVVRFVIKDCELAKDFIYVTEQKFTHIDGRPDTVLKLYDSYRCALLYDYFINLENSSIVTGVGMCISFAICKSILFESLKRPNGTHTCLCYYGHIQSKCEDIDTYIFTNKYHLKYRSSSDELIYTILKEIFL